MISALTTHHKKIIVAPLNWGLGHATRCIPVINQLLENGKEVILASDGEALELLQEEFPNLISEALPAYNVRYDGASLISLVLSNSPKVLSAILQEKRTATRLINKHQPDLIISDSRFGFRSKKIKSVIISHQLQLMSPNEFFGYWLNLVNKKLLNGFDACWIPDDPAINLSGALSQNEKIKNQKHLGILSRMKKGESKGEKYDITILLSGPEPARTKLEQALIKDLSKSQEKICLVRGTLRGPALNLAANWTMIERADSSQVNDLLLSSDRVISRSGYSSLMDYAALGVGAELIPTPGQTEQEYLAEYVSGRYGFSRYGKGEWIGC